MTQFPSRVHRGLDAASAYTTAAIFDSRGMPFQGLVVAAAGTFFAANLQTDLGITALDAVLACICVLMPLSLALLFVFALQCGESGYNPGPSLLAMVGLGTIPPGASAFGQPALEATLPVVGWALIALGVTSAAASVAHAVAWQRRDRARAREACEFVDELEETLTPEQLTWCAEQVTERWMGTRSDRDRLIAHAKWKGPEQLRHLAACAPQTLDIFLTDTRSAK